MRRYLIVIEKAKRNYAAFSPDLPGCVATGKTRLQTRRRMNAAIKMHLEGLREDGISIPVPSTTADYVTVG